MTVSIKWSSWPAQRRTYVVPDRHDQNHGDREGLVELGEAADLGEAVLVTKDLELRAAKVRGDAAALGKAVKGRGGDLDLLAALNEELGELVGLELGDDAVRVSS